ncbi:MAG: protein translocase subunit SecF [Gammaproteobacteria bacterium]|nr:protein translocase subunit SecF [Gammaproteobacteria bacterium]
MFELFRAKGTIRFMRHKMVACIISLTLVTIGLVSLATKGINWGLDFTGGTIVEVAYSQPVELDLVRQALDAGKVGAAVVQHFGATTDVLIRLAPQQGVAPEAIAEGVIASLKSTPDVSLELRRVEFIGPNIGEEFRDVAFMAALAAIAAILVYVSMRFEWRFAVGAVTALVHDTLMVMGLFSILQLEFDLTVMAAVMSVIGYSLNDTIVIFDRVRENFRVLRGVSTEENFDISLTQTLSRTFITAGTTMLVLLSLYLLGGQLLENFSLALLFGVFVGTYSSIYAASAVAFWLGVSREDLMPTQVEKEGADQAPLM